MAITVQQSPNTIDAVYNDSVYILSSSNVAMDNFKFICDVYVNSVMVDRMIVPPHPIHQTGFINIAPILEGRVSKDVDTDINDDGAEFCNNSYVLFDLHFGESYGSSGTIYADVTNVTGKLLWNAVFDYEDFCDDLSQDFICTAASPGRFSNRPSSGDIMIDDNAWLYYLSPTDNLGVYTARVKTFDSSGGIIATRIVNGSIGSFTYINRFPSGININDIPNADITRGGNQPILTSSVAKYSIVMLNTFGGVNMTEEYFYTMVSNCSIYEKHRIQFMNKVGGLDPFNFTLVSKGRSDIERSSFKKGLGSYASATSFNYSPSDRAKSQFFTKITDNKTITSDWVTEETYIWLEELVTSHDAYLDNGTNLIPINITNTTYETKKTVNDTLFNLTLDYTLSYNRYRQRI